MADALEGARELDRALQLLPQEISRKVGGAALMAGATIVADEMKARCPVGAEEHVYRHKGTRFRKQLLSRVVKSIRPAGFARTQISARLATAREKGQLAGIKTNTRQFSRSSLASELEASAPVALAGASKEAFYLKFLEFGWMMTGHGRSKKKRAGIKHVPPHPFLRPAWESTKARAFMAIAQAAERGIQEAATIVGRRK